MLIEFNPLSTQPYIDLPFQVSSWIGLFLMVGLLFWGFIRWRSFVTGKTLQQWVLTIFFVAATPFTLFLFNFYLPSQGVDLIPNLPIETEPPLIFILIAVPWVLAGGMVGAVSGGIVGLASGALMAAFVTHSLFTPLEMAGLGLVFGAAVRQNYRTSFYKFLRQPLAAMIFVALCYIPVYIILAFLGVPGSLAERLDYALAQNWLQIMARILPMLAAGIFGQMILWVAAPLWPKPAKLVPSPAEVSLETRFLTVSLPMILVLVVVLTLADWLVAGYAARQMIKDRLSNTARIAAESVPYFLEAGQSLILNMASPDLVGIDSNTLEIELANDIRSVSYFHQLTYFDESGEIQAAYPKRNFSLDDMTDEEEMGISLANKGVRLQIYTVPAVSAEAGPQISFIAAVLDASGASMGVLHGRADLKVNPFTQPALTALSTLSQDGGEGFILDEAGQVLFHTETFSSTSLGDTYGSVTGDAVFYDDVTATGTRQMVFYQPVVGRPWAVVATMPAQVAQQTSLEIAIPLLAILGLFTLLAYVLVRFSMSKVTSSLENLAMQAEHISQGQLSTPVPFSGVDEVGVLGKSFEQMRLSLKARLEELNKLLTVSQGVAAKLDINAAIKPILEAALADDVVSARAVLIPGVRMDVAVDKVVAISAGPGADQFAHLDNQVFELMRTQPTLSIQNTTRVRRISSLNHQMHPAALLALALKHENTYYGTLWLGYSQPRKFTDEEVRFLTTLAGEAAVAAANASLYASAELGRRRLEAVLTSTPEPVLVFDDKDQLLLLNPAAQQVPGLVSAPVPGKNARDVIIPPDLVTLLTSAMEVRTNTREIKLPNGRIYHAAIAPVMGEDHRVGKVCVLRDVSHYKELDAIKSDFVATVSHDLRSPLTLMRGYTTMMTFAGELNDQQKSYVNKMVQGVEEMSRLVNNLLDLGRIESGIKLKLGKMQPDTLVEQVITQLTPQANQKKIRLAFEPPEGEKPVDMVADVALIQQALINLVDNAIKYTKVGGEVVVRLMVEEEHIKFEVRDTGIGIAPLDLPRLFEKFYRSGRREAFEQRGTGLGLAIVKSIVERHGGQVTVSSQLGKGSVFTMNIPLQQPVALKPMVGLPAQKN